MQTKFRFPGREYAFAELTTTEGGVADNRRELMDVDDTFLTLVGSVLDHGCALAALAPLNPTIIDEPAWNDAATQPEWSTAPPQQTQGYQSAPQGYQAPQNGYQSQQATYQQPPQTPPGQQAPICQAHRQPATYKSAGVSQRTNKPYNAFWSCSLRDNACTKASNFPPA